MKPKYTPDMATVLRDTSRAKVEQERQAALERLQRPTPPDLFAQIGPKDDAAAYEVPQGGRGAGKKRAPVWLIGAVVAAVAVPVAIAVVMATRDTDRKIAAALASARASAVQVVSAAPVVTVTASANAPAASAAAAVPSAAPSAAPKAKAAPSVGGDPYDDAAAPVKTAAPMKSVEPVKTAEPAPSAAPAEPPPQLPKIID